MGPHSWWHFFSWTAHRPLASAILLPAGNFVSRFVVGNVSLSFGLLQFVIWLPESMVHSKALMVAGMFATFCLSVVGAVCDSAGDKECRGNDSIHSTAAVTFFVLYNMNMIILTVRRRSPTLLCTLLLSLLCKLRFVTHAAPSMVPQDQTILAIIEWCVRHALVMCLLKYRMPDKVVWLPHRSDVFLIIIWTVCFAWTQRGAAYTVALHTKSCGEESLLFFASSTAIMAVGAVLYVGTLLISLYFIYHQHRVPAGSLPFISDMWVYPPGNWISRWAVVQGCTLIAFVHLCLYRLDGDCSPLSTHALHNACVTHLLSLVYCHHIYSPIYADNNESCR